MAVASTRSN